MSRAEFESVRRSLAMAPGSIDLVDQVIRTCDELLRERDRVVELLADLPASWSTVRATLNDVYRALGVDVTANHPARRNARG